MLTAEEAAERRGLFDGRNALPSGAAVCTPALQQAIHRLRWSHKSMPVHQVRLTSTCQSSISGFCGN